MINSVSKGVGNQVSSQVVTPGAVGIATELRTRRGTPASQYRLILKAQKIRERLGGDLGVINAFPDRPKGMASAALQPAPRRARSSSGKQPCNAEALHRAGIS